MTLPDERYRAVQRTKQFLIDLCSSQRTPRVPTHIREQANALLRHYPSDYDMHLASMSAPDIFAEQMEDVTRLFKQYEQSKLNEN
mgnify:CR=1 FL=1